jgi:hypothetical protein
MVVQIVQFQLAGIGPEEWEAEAERSSGVRAQRHGSAIPARTRTAASICGPTAPRPRPTRRLLPGLGGCGIDARRAARPAGGPARRPRPRAGRLCCTSSVRTCRLPCSCTASPAWASTRCSRRSLPTRVRVAPPSCPRTGARSSRRKGASSTCSPRRRLGRPQTHASASRGHARRR